MRIWIFTVALLASLLVVQACKKSSPTPPAPSPNPATSTPTFTPSITTTFSVTRTGTATYTPTITLTATTTGTSTVTPTPTTTGTSTHTPTVTNTPCGSGASIGYSTTGGHTLNDAAIRAIQVQITNSGVLRMMYFLVPSASTGTVRFAVYSDNAGVPDALLGESGPLTLPFTAGTWGANLPNIPVTAGQYVWLAIMDHGVDIDYDDTATRPGPAVSKYWELDGPFPSDISPTSPNYYSPSLFVYECLGS